MFCTNCGKKVADSDMFCMNCGSKISDKPAAQKNSAPTAPKYTAPTTQPVYSTPVAPAYIAPVGQLKTNRGLFKFILLSLITFGIYGLVAMSAVSTDVNTIASRYDGKKTMHFCLIFFIFSWLTFGIVPLVWYHKISNRIGVEAARRRIDYKFGAGTFWGWGFFGILIFVGPFIYIHKLFKAMNLLAADYNTNG